MLIFGLPVIKKFGKNSKWIMILIYCIFHGLNGINNGPANVFEAEVAREITDYTEYVTGERPDGTINILTDLVTKIKAPINAVFTICMLNASTTMRVAAAVGARKLSKPVKKSFRKEA